MQHSLHKLYHPVFPTRYVHPRFSLQEAECAYVIILMAVYWCTEVLPLAVTALLPALLFPLFGIMESKDVSFGESTHCQDDFPTHTLHVLPSVCSCHSRCVCSTWKTPICFLWRVWWSRWLWNTGTCTSASRCGCCFLSGCVRHCEWLTHAILV